MRYSRALIRTSKEAPADATTVSHSLLTRAGYVRRMGAGLYSFLPLGMRVLRRIEQIVIGEMEAAGAEQVLMPALLPADYFRESGRWDSFGPELFRLQDRKQADYHLGPTHEEIITDLARREIQSYRDLPKNLFQVQTKFRDEPRPRAGLLRCREFLMKDAYSFDTDVDAAERAYATMRDAYIRIFDRTGLTYRRVDADAASMGGVRSEEFQVLVQSGEDIVIACEACDYAANVEIAESQAEAAPPTAVPPAAPEAVATPGKRSIADVSTLLSVPPAHLLKSLLFRVASTGEWVLAVVRGDHELSPEKLARHLGVRDLELADEAAVPHVVGAKAGSVGPVGFKHRRVVDPHAAQLGSAVCGANRDGEHLRGVVFDRDYTGAVVDIRGVREGERCTRCGGALRQFRGIEAGHIFILGTRYSDRMGATYLDREQKKQPLFMGCYGIGVSRLVAAAVEQHHDAAGICWPLSIAPYAVQLVQLGDEARVQATVATLEAGLERQGISVLVDDRDERPGVKFKDADLLGMPLRVTVGERGLAEGNLELKLRTAPEVIKVPVDQGLSLIVQKLEQLRAAEAAASTKK
jgi:prolyl-tRNA synthetase